LFLLGIYRRKFTKVCLSGTAFQWTIIDHRSI
jgi:hypothetical protein